MFYTGTMGVLSRALYKRDLLAMNDPRASDIRLLLLILGGTMRGAYGGGQVCALEAWGLSEVFDNVVGISTGAPTAAFFLALQAVLGTSIYHEECTTPRFMSLRWPPVNADYLAQLFRGEVGAKRLDQEAIYASRSNFFIAATCAMTGKGILLDAKAAKPDIVQAIRASIAIPRFSGGPVAVGEEVCLDGAGAFAFPLREMMERFQPTDVLVLANAPLPSDNLLMRRIKHALDQTRYSLATVGYPAPVRKTFIASKGRLLEEAAWFDEHRPPGVGIIWTDGSVGSFERNPAKLKAASLQAEHHLSRLLATARGLPV